MHPVHRTLQPVKTSDDAGERALLRRVGARDRAAMREFYLLYHRRLARFLMRIDRRYGLVEEIVNDTMLAVWQQAGSFRGESRVSTWVMGIAWRQGLKSIRTATRAERHSSGVPDFGAEELPPAEVSERREWLGKALALLSVEQRATLELTYYGGYSCEEIAGIMECPTNTVKTRMYYAREKLRGVLPQLATPTAEGAP